MSWQEKPIIKGADVIEDVPVGTKDKILQEEKEGELLRQEAHNRKINHERRKAAKESGIPFVSIEEEARQKIEEEKRTIEEKQQKKAQLTTSPEMWKSILEHRHTIIGKIDLEQFEKKPEKENSQNESIFNAEIFEELYRQAQRVLGDEAIDEEYVKTIVKDFITLYNYEEIENDIKNVIEKEERIKRTDTPEKARMKKLATILEAMLVEGIAKYDWLGTKIKILPPSKHDELFNSVDGIIELGRDEALNEFLALGIDVSFRSVKRELFEEKIETLLDYIDKGKLTQIKYFKDNNGEVMENLYVPKVVVSVDMKTIEELVQIWSNRKDPDFKEKFKKHTIAIDVIGQIAEQCKLFATYAAKIGFTDIAEKYDEAFELLLKISQEVPQAREAITSFEQSKFVNKIEQIMNNRKFTIITPGSLAA